jgi:hypothetical protein
MMKLMKSTMKRMVLTGAAIAVMMSFAAPAMAQEEQQLNICEIFPDVCPEDPPVPEPDTPDICDKFPQLCSGEDLPVLEPDTPNICDKFPQLCSGEDLPVLEPDTPDKDDPPIADPPPPPPPGKNDPVVDPPGKDNPDNEQSDTSGSGGSSGGSSGGGSGDGGGIGGSASETIDRGGTFVSSFVPTALTSTIGEAGNSVKENLPAAVAKSLPNTGGGWTFLILVAAGLIAGAFLIRSIAARHSANSTRTAQ